MITELQYNEALNTIKLYEKEQEDLRNSIRMKLGYFIGRIPRITGKHGTIRLINVLLIAAEGDRFCKRVEYLDELNQNTIFEFRNIGVKTAKLFFEYKDKILSNSIDAYDT
jgi:hypothetical protein